MPNPARPPSPPGHPAAPHRTADPTGAGQADTLTRALERFPSALQGTGARITGPVHDEIIIEAPEAEAQEVATRLETVMRQAGHTDSTHAPVEVGVMIAQDCTKN
jgi:DNA polymerase I-like protein with 3'-5' exonuclease and polymerase domains